MGAVKQYVRDISSSIVTTLEGMAVTMSWVFRKPMTIQYPFHKSDPKTPIGGPDTLPERYRGFLEVDMEVCSACLACERACPIECIRIQVDKVQPQGDPQAKPIRVMTRFDIDIGKCMFCGLCVEPCPTEAIRHTTQFESAVANVEHLVARFIDPKNPVVPTKIKKGEEKISTVPRGSIVKGLFVDRPWDSPPIDFPEIVEPETPPDA